MSSRMYLVGIGDTDLSGIKDGKFVRLCISIHYCLQIFFIFFAAFITGTHKWLAAPSDCCLTFWMNPWQHLVYVSNIYEYSSENSMCSKYHIIKTSSLFKHSFFCIFSSKWRVRPITATIVAMRCNVCLGQDERSLTRWALKKSPSTSKLLWF